MRRIMMVIAIGSLVACGRGGGRSVTPPPPPAPAPGATHAPVRTVVFEQLNQAAAAASAGGLTMNPGDRTLWVNSGPLNGIWVYSGVGDEWVRATDADFVNDLFPGAVMLVTEGSEAGRYWEMKTSGTTPWNAGSTSTWGEWEPSSVRSSPTTVAD